MDAGHKKEAATYQLYKGVKTLGKGEPDTAEKCFRDGIALSDNLHF